MKFWEKCLKIWKFDIKMYKNLKIWNYFNTFEMTKDGVCLLSFLVNLRASSGAKFPPRWMQFAPEAAKFSAKEETTELIGFRAKTMDKKLEKERKRSIFELKVNLKEVMLVEGQGFYWRTTKGREN